MGSKSRKSAYQPVPFHVVRSISLLSNSIITGILVYFLLKLKSDGFKLPWTLLIVLAVSILTLVYLLISSCVHLCATLSPLFSLVINVPILLLWIIAFSLFTYNIYGLLAHSCTTSNWGNSRGVTVCSLYKTFFSFTLFAVLAHTALIVLDVRARQRQNRQGIYDRMQEESKDNLKMDTFDSTTGHTVHDVPYGVVPDSVDAPIYRGTDNFYENTDTSYRGSDPSVRTGRPTHLSDGRPGLYSREASSHQSERSDAPMLNNYGARWASEQQTTYQSGRYDSPHR